MSKYWTVRYSSLIDKTFGLIFGFGISAIFLWLINGGKNDLGVIHLASVYTVFACLLSITIVALVLFIMIVRDAMVLLYDKWKDGK